MDIFIFGVTCTGSMVTDGFFVTITLVSEYNSYARALLYYRYNCDSRRFEIQAKLVGVGHLNGRGVDL